MTIDVGADSISALRGCVTRTLAPAAARAHLGHCATGSAASHAHRHLHQITHFTCAHSYNYNAFTLCFYYCLYHYTELVLQIHSV